MAYRGLSLQVFDSQMHSFERLSEVDRSLIPNLPIRLSHAAEAVEHNADVIERIAELAGIDNSFDPDEIIHDELEQTVADFPDVVDGLLAIVRDWSVVGEKDRMLTYDPIIHALDEAVEDAITSGAVAERKYFSVLVPGASLGRLSWELARLGLAVQGVESSYLQLFMCNFVLNGKATPENPLHLYPFAHHTGMIRSIDEQLKEVEFPDANPRVLEAKILKIGAVWINHGCLDFKYDDSLTESSVEITKEELDLVIARCDSPGVQNVDLSLRSEITFEFLCAYAKEKILLTPKIIGLVIITYNCGLSRASTILQAMADNSTALATEVSNLEKRIKTDEDLQAFLKSRQFAELWAYMLRLNMSVADKKCSAVNLVEASSGVKSIVSVLEKLEKWAHEIEPTQQAARFGNKAFRTWHARLCEHAVSLTETIVGTWDKEYTERTGRSLEEVSIELAEYLKTSFGNETRIDYGSGHEAHFLVLLYCLARIGVLQEADDEEVVLIVFPSYLKTTRLLQTRYMLEPAGSHGVWGLDDYSFLPFLWGSSQLVSSNRVTPSVIHDEVALRELRYEYLYLDAIAFIQEMKTGPFPEHSPMLHDISGVNGGWKKINSGMIKMYRGEVWQKRPVIQHFLFGTIFHFER
ncbi:unnamed protein product [Agarophyton chilense]